MTLSPHGPHRPEAAAAPPVIAVSSQQNDRCKLRRSKDLFGCLLACLHYKIVVAQLCHLQRPETQVRSKAGLYGFSIDKKLLKPVEKLGEMLLLVLLF